LAISEQVFGVSEQVLRGFQRVILQFLGASSSMFLMVLEQVICQLRSSFGAISLATSELLQRF